MTSKVVSSNNADTLGRFGSMLRLEMITSDVVDERGSYLEIMFLVECEKRWVPERGDQ